MVVQERDEMEIHFEFEKETKRTYRFKELRDDPEDVIVGTIYVQKHVFESKPKTLKVTIEEE